MIALVAFALAVTPPAPSSADSTTSQPMTLGTPAGSIYGTLLVPSSAAKPVPVVLIIAGSGPTNRDGDNPIMPGNSAPLRLLAEALAREGVASLRYDKRGIGASKISPEAMRAVRFDDFVDDASAWLKILARDKRFSRVVVAGHSEGALIGAIAAARAPGTAMISLDGAGKPAADILHEQFLGAAPELRAQADTIMRALRAGHTVDSVPPALLPIFNHSVQQYEISWFKYDPAVELARVSGPILIVQGANDMQVAPDNARILAAAVAPRGKLVMIDSMTHELKLAGPDRQSNLRTYTDGSIPIAAPLVRAIVEFIATLGRAAH